MLLPCHTAVQACSRIQSHNVGSSSTACLWSYRLRCELYAFHYVFYQILQVIGSNTLCHNSCHIAAQMNFVCMAHNLQAEVVRQFYPTGGYPNKCTERMRVLYQENGCTAVKVHTH